MMMMMMYIKLTMALSAFVFIFLRFYQMPMGYNPYGYGMPYMPYPTQGQAGYPGGAPVQQPYPYPQQPPQQQPYYPQQ